MSYDPSGPLPPEYLWAQRHGEIQIRNPDIKSAADIFIQYGTGDRPSAYPVIRYGEGIFMALVVMDAGHGGNNPGAVYSGRREKDDVLALTLAVGRILERNGVEVYYTRTEDAYKSPTQRAREANAVQADYFVSIHRNSSPYPNQYTGVESLVYNRYGEAGRLAANINTRLEQVGFENQGVNEGTNFVVLNQTRMPAVLVEAGFLNTDADNQLFDERFEDIAGAIAEGILATVWSA